MISTLMALEFLKMQEEARRSAQKHYDDMANMRAIGAANLAHLEELMRASYGRDVIDVEAREVVDVPLLGAP